ncbi:uncharacterized protein LOC132731956 [Ruditapes philippinarum]|uniref:uncharacterized protein LOC132731956 n=1 Tax=Ruditapes philippinarum TaxID=129788 RepID=UPI00295BF2C5|nr:uncharacterized protein LOC132731956 [Ruditapes philippinarum]
MAHEIHLKNNKYRQWVKAGLGLGYLKEGLAPFCDDIGRQQHKDIINKIQQTKTPQPNVPCSACRITALQPDHVRVSKGICPLNQDKCNCCFPNKKRPCPNNVCGAIYDSIIQYHASMPLAPFWKNSDVQQWSTEPWEVCKCFINAPGYKDKTSADETDCTGLLHVIINNKYFHSHIGGNVAGPNNLFSKVRQYRNMIFHSSSMELEESDANTYIDDMITVLQDSKELVHQPAAQQAVLKLQDLKKKDFIITTVDFDEILGQINEEMKKVLNSIDDAATKQEYDDLKKKFIEFETKMSEEKDGEKLENEKELKDLKKTITELESQMVQEKKEKLEMEIEHVDLKKKFTVLETLVAEQKKEMAKIKTETSSGKSQTDYDQAKLEWREKLIEQYQKTLLQVPTTPLQPKSEKCSFNEIYIRPKITREIIREKGETKEVEVKTMSEIFTKDEVPKKSVYVIGDAGSGKTSFCKYLVNCWCLAHSEEHEADNENEDGNGKPEGNSEKHGDDSKKHGACNENEDGSSKPEGDSEKHEGDNENQGGVNENESGTEEQGGDNEGHETHGAGGVDEIEDGKEKHRGDFEEHEKRGSDIVNKEVKGAHSGDIENEEGSKTHQGVIEKRGNEKHVGDMKKNGSDSDDIQDNNDDLVHSESHNDDSDGDSMPSESNIYDSDDILTGFKFDSDGYVDRLNDYIFDSDDTDDIITDFKFDSDGSDGDLTDSEFDSNDSEYDSKNYELKFNGVIEMKKFDFVFYIPLRQYRNIDTIDEMLQKRYQMKMLNTLLEEESSRVIILLDGLDEWSSENVPGHSIFKKYTILTTSRPWKFHTLRSSDVKIEQSLNLKGFDFRCEWEMVNRTVSQLNIKRHSSKEARDCREKLKEESLESLKQVPIMLHQLICLWFDGKLDKTLRCAIYTGMLELFFTWNDMKTTGTSTRLMKSAQKVDLPKYLADKTKLRLNRHFIYEVSQLAYETLFNCPKDKSLTFDICMFDEVEISDEVRENCLKLGIMTEDECPSLSVSEPPSSLFSFIHKSMQEFLAAANIGINFNMKLGSSDSKGNEELAKKFIKEVF